MTKKLTKKELELQKQQKEVSKKLLEIFNSNDLPVISVQRNIEIFKNAIQMETFKLKSKKLKTLGIKLKKDEEKSPYEEYHNSILEAINELPIGLAEAVLDNLLQAIDTVMQKKKFETKFKDLEIILKEDE